jgi:hypothetical protein
LYAVFGLHDYYLAGFSFWWFDLAFLVSCGALVTNAQKAGSQISDNAVRNIGLGMLGGLGLTLLVIIVTGPGWSLLALCSFAAVLVLIGGLIGYRKSYPSAGHSSGGKARSAPPQTASEVFDGIAKAGRKTLDVVEGIIAIGWGVVSFIGAIALLSSTPPAPNGVLVFVFAVWAVAGGYPLFHGFRLLTKTVEGEKPFERSEVHGGARIATREELVRGGLLKQ